MARQESDREDLFEEAKALIRRLEIPWRERTVVVGARRTGAWSIYLGPDHVAGFTSAGELRRAYWQGYLYRADRGRGLSKLRRLRDDDATILAAESLSEDARRMFVAQLQSELVAFRDDWRAGVAAPLRWAPADERTALEQEATAWLDARCRDAIVVADGM